MDLKKKLFFTATKYVPERFIFSIRRISKLFYDSEYNKISMLSKGLIPGGSLVFDIGAYVGDYTKIFRRLGHTVIAVEPNPISFNYLNKRFKRDEHVKAINSGVGDKIGTLPFFICKNRPTVSTFSKKHKTEKFFV